ncbi:MAG: extracellular solute-binding protein [Acidobacteriota bacterium]
MKTLRWIPALAILCLTACSPAATPPVEEEVEQNVTVYSGRNESLIGPLLARFKEQTGITVDVRYGDTAELAATLLEEGAATPAQVFISQDAGALGAVAAQGLFKTLPADVTGRVPARFQDPQGRWVGVSGRARVVVYNTASTTPEELPQSLAAVGEERFAGKFGVAPLNGSFQAHMAVVKVAEGDEALEALLAAIAGNDPQRYPKNSAIVEAVIRGEVDWGLTNHYYLWRALSENPEAPAKNYFMPEGAASSFVNLAGAGVLSEDEATLELVRFLVSDEAQSYFADETFEYPLVAGVAASTDLPPLDGVEVPDVDFAQVADALPATLEAIRASGLE